ncbi:serine/threonine protein kinase [Mucilaginibacter sp. E4BP6]|uniref:serine/threonine protein kinase n=1 Tax=Mucilaginibacter sp. E4BP6 TaxID=2723089 RepID=UPI0015C79DE6|nr:protein kinase [Mucilaginibacter sp. E4BP6]NYE64923.1 hypothetical protein [Mucilaginibacter sp. E4BP6]
MQKAIVVQLVSFAPLLNGEGIRYREDKTCLTIGDMSNYTGWVIFLSCRTLETIYVIKTVLPLLKNAKASYRLIKNQEQQYRLNSGAFGETEVGKVITIFPCSEQSAIDLSVTLTRATNRYKGPVVPDALRIGSVVFLQVARAIPNESGVNIQLSHPGKMKIPFTVPKEYQIKKKRKIIIGKYFIPVELLRASPKGDIYKAINLKNLAFTWCLIKQGKPVALDDHFNREMKDRLLWQKEVLQLLSPHIYTPSVLDFFEEDGSSYLILDFAEGESISKLIHDKLKGLTWKEINFLDKDLILGWFLKSLEIVQKVHAAGYVHRDISDSNFLVMEDGNICIIDFELSYSLEKQEPNPPFLLGTFGYAAPEQLQMYVADPKEDIYSFGALLAFMITGIHPIELIEENINNTKAKLYRLTGSPELVKIILNCLEVSRKDRPELITIHQTIKRHTETLKRQKS